MTTLPTKLTDWLRRLEAQHPREIDLGLDRIARVAARLGGAAPSRLVISVAGTNGKGSCCFLLETLLRVQGLRVGLYTSPHLLRFNERIRIDGREASDAELCKVFSRVEAARGDVSLTYFEFTTLAALLLLGEQDLDAVILEVGLGGRLDAVNIVDADLALITSIARDHEQWLGLDLDSIAAEKAGILRPFKPLVYGEVPFPDSVAARVRSLKCPVYRRGREFDLHVGPDRWQWSGRDRSGGRIELTDLPMPAILLDNAASVLQTLVLLELLPKESALHAELSGFAVRGRCQTLELSGLAVVLDVAHNPAAAAKLREHLAATPVQGATIAVFAAMKDKDISGMFAALTSEVDGWILADIPDNARAAEAQASAEMARAAGLDVRGVYPDVAAAFAAARPLAGTQGRVVVCGSFLTVAAVVQTIGSDQDTEAALP